MAFTQVDIRLDLNYERSQAAYLEHFDICGL